MTANPAQTHGKQSPVVSVIVPCYGQAKYLPESVQSVIDQTFGDWECIIINDGSPDNTREVALVLAAGDSRIRYIEQANGGVSRARNRGLDEARGRYIQFLDADDLIRPEKFEQQLGRLPGGPGLELAYTDYRYCKADDPGTTIVELYVSPKMAAEHPLRDMALRWETGLTIPIHSFLFDARFFREHMIRFDESLPNNEDWECWMRVLSLAPEIHYLDHEMAVYRYHDSARTRDRSLMRKGFLRAIDIQRRRFRGDPAMSAVLLDKRRITVRAYARYAPRWQRALPNAVTASRVFLGRVVPRDVKDMIKRCVGVKSLLILVACLICRR